MAQDSRVDSGRICSKYLGVQFRTDLAAGFGQQMPRAGLMPAPLFEETAGELFNRLKPGHFDSPMTMHVVVIEQLADLFQASQLSADIRFQNPGLDHRLRLP